MRLYFQGEIPRFARNDNALLTVFAQWRCKIAATESVQYPRPKARPLPQRELLPGPG
jgi:hypothetical protein